MTQKCDQEFKLHAVQLAVEDGKATTQVARELGIAHKALII
ncbi:transposase [Alicyclobacillaceae bacterium I2511]|nr:transposase [Alicyclobacillaceae bacterium I2511]